MNAKKIERRKEQLKNKPQPIIKNGNIFNVKIFYNNGGHKYANIMKEEMYNLGKKYGSIIGCRKMNTIEKFIFRNCM